MPGLGGLEVLSRIRRTWPDKPVIVVSGAGDMGDVVAALRLGAWDYFTKPLEDLMIVRRAIERALDHSLLLAENDRHRRNLESLVRERTAELVRAGKAKDEFLAVLSHELRTPLTPALLILSALRDDSEIAESVRQEIEIACRQVQIESSLIDDLLDFTQMTTGKLKILPQPGNMHAIIRAAASAADADLAGKNILLELRLDASEAGIAADGARLAQVFEKILHNAAKFSPEGAVVSVKTWNEVAAGTTGIIAEVRDAGVGMTPEVIARVFEIFEQADRSRTRTQGGLGIGLALSKAIIELHGGSIEASSPGKDLGSAFRVRLPCLAPHPILPVAPQQAGLNLA
jgi:two-component system CheB/CheR fusion protein